MDTENALRPRRWRILIIVFACLAIASPLFYSLYTQQAWEDFFITFRHSQNLVEGHGLVYNTGERVHGFTSPLGTLLPALCYLATGKSSYLSALWMFRVLSILAFAGSGVFLLLSLRNKNSGLPAACLLSAFYVFETKSVAFSSNGMETAFMLFFLAGYIFLCSRDLFASWLPAGLCWAGLMWTRPDSLIYIAALFIAQLVFSERPRKETLVTLLKVTAVCIAAYLPWVIWAWSYYGSPIPHTIIAKAHLMPQMTWLVVFQYLFGPIYPRFGTWPLWIKILSYWLGIFAYFYWLIPGKNRFTRMLSLVFFLLCLYLLVIRTSPWYFPPVTAIGLFVLINGLFALAEMDKTLVARDRKLVVTLLLLILPAMIYVFAMTCIEMRIQQKEIETGNRQRIGLWLKENMRKGEKLYLEPMGYIGYFSRARVMDYPGLVSPEVVRLLNKNPGMNFYTLVREIQPEWIVLRPQEAQIISSLDYFRRNYALEKTFDVLGNLRRYKFIPGIVYVSYDAKFLVFKFRGSSPAQLGKDPS